MKNLSSAIYDRLETYDTAVSNYGMEILSTEGWIQSEGGSGLFSDYTELLCEFYEIPPSQASFCGSVRELLDRWHNLKQYTIDYLQPEILSYKEVWRKTFSSSSNEKWKLVLLLVEL